jgi:hypothetical protein
MQQNKFLIQEIEIDVEDDNETSVKKSAKDALLLWCQERRRTQRRMRHAYELKSKINLKDDRYFEFAPYGPRYGYS